MSLGVLDDRSWRIEAHRLRVEDRRGELRCVVVLEIRRCVHQQREARGVRFRKSIVGERVDLIVNPQRNVFRDAVPLHAVDELLTNGGHALATALVPHRLAKRVRFAGREARGRDRNLHPLLLKEGDAKGSLENRFQRGMGVRHLFHAGTPSEIRMHHVAVDRTGADDRDFDDEVVKASRLETRQRVHLRATLHLKDADRVRGGEVVVDRLVVHVELREIDRDAARLPDVQNALLNQRQHAKPKDIDLHEAHRIEVVLFPLDDRAVFHRCGLDGHDGRQGLFREYETSDVNRTVSRKLMQPFDEIGEHAHALVAGIQPSLLNDAGRGLRLAQCSRGIAAFVVGLLRVWVIPR